MLSSEIYYKVDEIDKSTISINGFVYNTVKVKLPKDIDMVIYVSEKAMKYVKEGKYYYTKNAYLTSRYEDEVKHGDFGFRVDYASNSTEDEFNEQEDTEVTFNAKARRHENNKLKHLGPMRIPTYSTRTVLKNERGRRFKILVVGYHSKAKLLNSLSKVCYIDVIGNISAPKVQGLPCAIVVKDIILRKEVEI